MRWRQSNLSCFQTVFNDNDYNNLYNILNCLSAIILIYSGNTYIEWINDRLLTHVLFLLPLPLPPNRVSVSHPSERLRLSGGVEGKVMFLGGFFFQSSFYIIRLLDFRFGGEDSKYAIGFSCSYLLPIQKNWVVEVHIFSITPPSLRKWQH